MLIKGLCDITEMISRHAFVALTHIFALTQGWIKWKALKEIL